MDYKKIYEIGTKIGNLKIKLEKSDYKAIKFGEGLISPNDYEVIKKQRESWRQEINILENELKKYMS